MVMLLWRPFPAEDHPSGLERGTPQAGSPRCITGLLLITVAASQVSKCFKLIPSLSKPLDSSDLLMFRFFRLLSSLTDNTSMPVAACQLSRLSSGSELLDASRQSTLWAALRWSRATVGPKSAGCHCLCIACAAVYPCQC